MYNINNLFKNIPMSTEVFLVIKLFSTPFLFFNAKLTLEMSENFKANIYALNSNF